MGYLEGFKNDTNIKTKNERVYEKSGWKCSVGSFSLGLGLGWTSLGYLEGFKKDKKIKTKNERVYEKSGWKCSVGSFCLVDAADISMEIFDVFKNTSVDAAYFCAFWTFYLEILMDIWNIYSYILKDLPFLLFQISNIDLQKW